MRYLFINTGAGYASTGRIAAETCRKLMAQGHECLIAYGRDKVNCDDIPTLRIGNGFDFRFHGVMTRIFDNHGFCSKAVTRKFLDQVREYDPDVIWLHNIHGYYIHVGLLFDYLRTCGKKIIWTLHDCWSFTGHCSHYDYAGCDKWRTGCHHCPQKGQYPASLLLDNSKQNYENKKRSFTGIPNLRLIAPSRWLADQVRQSFLGEYPVEVVYNTINLEIFRPTESDFRARHGLEGKRMLLGVASVWDQRKGLEDFVRMAGELDENTRIVLVGLTKEQSQTMPEGILPILRTNSARELAEIYTAADVFVNPTYEEVLGLVNLEARACGTRIVCYDSGGCRETLGEGDCLVPRGQWQILLAKALEQAPAE